MHLTALTLKATRFCVRRAYDGEKIVTLDEQEYTMSPANLVICDGVKPVALAGVMGGLNSEIRDTTESVMFELLSLQEIMSERLQEHLESPLIQVQDLRRAWMNTQLFLV